jgi:hypothetical protein
MDKMVPMNAVVSYGILSVVVAVVATFVAYQLWVDPSQPIAEGFAGRTEGFAGPATGAGIPDCLRSSSESAELYAFITRQAAPSDEAADDVRELSAILGKFSCFKRDLMSPSGIVEATRQQQFYTSHDIEPIAETTARCFAKTIPQRDLEIAFDKWKARGTQLIKRICKFYKYSESDLKQALSLFQKAYSDIHEVALSACCEGAPTLAGGEAPRMVHGFEPSSLLVLRDYNGYY